MPNDKPAADTTKKTNQPSKEVCPDDFAPKPDLDGKNDSGPDPEVHGRELPPQ